MSREITLQDVMDSIVEIKSEIAEIKVELKASEVRQREYTDRAVKKLALEFIPGFEEGDSRVHDDPNEERVFAGIFERLVKILVDKKIISNEDFPMNIESN